MNNYETAMNLLNQHSSSEMSVSEIKQILSENNFSENEINAVFGQLRREKRNFKRGIFNVKFNYEPLETEPVLEMTETILTKEQKTKFKELKAKKDAERKALKKALFIR